MPERFDPAALRAQLERVGPVVDAHHHLWDLEANRYPWLQDAPVRMHFGDYAAIRRSYLPDDLRRDAGPVRLLATVHVEAHWRGGDSSEGETAWLDVQARTCGLPDAIVGHADLTEPDVAPVLDAHCAFGRFRGVRMMTRRAVEPSGAALLDDPGFRRGFALLGPRGLSFDLQAPPETMEAAARLTADFPETTVILTHAGLPLDRSAAGLAAWRRGLAQLAACENVVAKLSGLPMSDPAWTPESLAPMVRALLEAFGPDRVMFGSNFPVDGMFSDYPALVAGYAAALHDDELEPVFRATAARIYRLTLPEPERLTT